MKNTDIPVTRTENSRQRNVRIERNLGNSISRIAIIQNL